MGEGAIRKIFGICNFACVYWHTITFLFDSLELTRRKYFKYIACLFFTEINLINDGIEDCHN